MDLNNFKYIVVGAGFFGATIAERIAQELKAKVLVIEKRNHTGGNSHSEIDAETGIEYHKYGSHIFHTSNRQVWAYINRFSRFSNYRHRVFANQAGRVYAFPINLSTVNDFFAQALRPYEVEPFLRQKGEIQNISDPQNFYEKAISSIGISLYEAFIEGYTKKQWQTDPRNLPPGLFDRLIIRKNYLNDYFDDPFQGIPSQGYGALFRELLNHKRITVRTGIDFFDLAPSIPGETLIIFSGPIDRYFNYQHGKLGWRTLQFERRVYAYEDFQGTAVMNYADEAVPYTRTHEFRHYHPERQIANKTLVFREYPKPVGVSNTPYYPNNTRQDRKLLERYHAAAAQIPNVLFGGRLGSYCYLNMDEAIANAFHLFENRIQPLSA